MAERQLLLFMRNMRISAHMAITSEHINYPTVRALRLPGQPMRSYRPPDRRCNNWPRSTPLPAMVRVSSFAVLPRNDRKPELAFALWHPAVCCPVFTLD